MDGQNAFGLQHPQGIPQRLQGNIQQLDELVLRNEGPHGQLALKQAIQDAAVGDLAQSARVSGLTVVFGGRRGIQQPFRTHQWDSDFKGLVIYH